MPDVNWHIGSILFNPVPVEMCILLSLFVAFTLPAMLPGTSKLHRGFNLYNGGLATGLIGLFLYAFMFKTMGVEPEGALKVENAVYLSHGESYMLFGTLFFVVFSVALILLPLIDTYVNHTEKWGQDDRSKDPRDENDKHLFW